MKAHLAIGIPLLTIATAWGCGGSDNARGLGGASGTSLAGGSSAQGGRNDSGGASGTGGLSSLGGGLGSAGSSAKGGSTGASTHSSAGGSSAVVSTGGSAGRGGGAGGGGKTVTSTSASGGAGGAAGSKGGDTGGGGGSPRDDGGVSGDALAVDGAKADAPEAGGSAQTCPTGLPAPSAGNRKGTLQHGGKSRTYTLHVPSGLSAGKPLALVFDLHGAGGSGTGQQRDSGWGAVADREKFLMAYPDGIDGYWNVDDTCCGTAGKQKIDDVGFLKALILALSKDICIDATRIYVTGFSNGGGLTHRMGCDAADVIAAIAPMATDLRTQPCKPVRPISMMEFRGTKDSLEPYEGGLVGPAGGQYVAVGAKASLKLWADINQCTGTTTPIDKYCESYTACQGGVESDLCSMTGVDHSPYQHNLDFNAAEVAWKMFQRQAMR